MDKKNIGLIGLAVMGENLVLNMESKGFSVSVFNRTTSKVEAFISGRAQGKNIHGCFSIEELVQSLERPRKIMLLVKAGQPVDDFIDLLIPYLESGDIIIDGDDILGDGVNVAARLEGLAKPGHSLTAALA